METRRRRSSSGEMFTFPITPIQDHANYEFEFGCVTPDSPSSKNSPADDLFFNGRLLPHSFPVQPANVRIHDYSRSGSRTSSVSSKDSLMSSRSNSTNSRSSSCSSARTSSSDNSERKMWAQNRVLAGKTSITRERFNGNRGISSIQSYGSSQRWQFITPAPVLNPEVFRIKKAEAGTGAERREKKQEKKNTTASSSGFGRRFFRSFVSACRECHAMEPSTKGNVEYQS